MIFKKLSYTALEIAKANLAADKAQLLAHMHVVSGGAAGYTILF